MRTLALWRFNETGDARPVDAIGNVSLLREPSGAPADILGAAAIVEASEVVAGAGVTWDVDATSGIAVPSTLAQWNSFRTFHGLTMPAPSGLYLCQEAAGNLTDTIGGVTLTAQNAPLYQQAAAGWTRKGVGCTDGSSQRFTAAAGVGPNPTTTSQIWLWLAIPPGVAPGSARDLCGLFGATPSSLRTTGALLPRYLSDGVTVDGATAFTGAWNMLATRYDRANSRTVGYTTSERLVGTYAGTTTDGNKGIGDGPTTAAAATYVYGVRWDGAAAEVTDAVFKACVVAMGIPALWPTT
jgi:hypothetical protein